MPRAIWMYKKIKNIDAPLAWIERISHPLFTSRWIWEIILKAVVISLEKFIAKNNPVKIWIIRHIPRSEPKFHIYEILEGVGRFFIGDNNLSNMRYVNFLIGALIHFKFLETIMRVIIKKNIIKIIIVT